MIKATVLEYRNAYPALLAAFDMKLKGKAAYRVTRMISKVKSVLIDAEDLQTQIIKAAGGEMIPNPNGGTQLGLKPPARNKDHTDDEHNAVEEEFKESVESVTASMKALNEDDRTIEWDPIPMSMFDESFTFAPKDLVELDKFIEWPEDATDKVVDIKEAVIDGRDETLEAG